MVAIVVAVTVVVGTVLDAGLSPSVKPVAAVLVAAAVTVATGVEVVVTDPSGLSMKDKPAPGAVDVAAALVVKAGATPRVKPVPVAVGAAAEVIGAAKVDGPEVGAAWVDAGGAGVVEGLIPKANPPPWVVVAGVVEAG